jgi:hypothetical protein
MNAVAKETKYYAIVDFGRTLDNPSGLARRHFTPEGSIDETLRRNLTWGPSSIIIEREHGELGYDLVEISETEAEALLERFRSRWQPTEW